METTEQNDIDP
jgi:hypothetical protein